MSDNWIVQNLENALKTWNDKLSEIWQLITQSPEQFKGGTIWNVIVDIHGAVQAIGLALLVLFFVIGVMKTCGSFAEVKKARTRSEAVYSLCPCKRCCDLWLGTNDGSVQHCAGFNINHYERRRFRLGCTDGIAAGDCHGC